MPQLRRFLGDERRGRSEDEDKTIGPFEPKLGLKPCFVEIWNPLGELEDEPRRIFIYTAYVKYSNDAVKQDIESNISLHLFVILCLLLYSHTHTRCICTCMHTYLCVFLFISIINIDIYLCLYLYMHSLKKNRVKQLTFCKENTSLPNCNWGKSATEQQRSQSPKSHYAEKRMATAHEVRHDLAMHILTHTSHKQGKTT